ncbi:response regulator [Omnitrophica bacterium]|nr:response regulator [Candidatus Omnitrophota bacterium]
MTKLKILFIDDDSDFLEVMKLIWEQEGYEVFIAASGKEGVEKFKKERPSAVVVDCMMPVMDGIATMKEIREVDKETSAILFTGRPDIELIEDIKELNISAMVPKESARSNPTTTLKNIFETIERRLAAKD